MIKKSSVLLFLCLSLCTLGYAQNNNEITYSGGIVTLVVIDQNSGKVLIDRVEGKVAEIKYDPFYNSLAVLYKNKTGLVVMSLTFQRKEKDYSLYIHDNDVFKVKNGLDKDGVLLLQYAKPNSENALIFLKFSGVQRG